MLRTTYLCVALPLLLCTALAQGCTCDCKWKPVCGEDPNTYTNACIATCQGIAMSRNGVCAGGPSAKPSSIREDCTANLELMNAFQGEGFVFIGRESFKQRTGPPDPPQNVADNPGKPSAEDLAAFRITSDGFTYASSSKRGGGPAVPGYTKTEGHKPVNVPQPHARRNLREIFEGQKIETLDGSLGSNDRDLLVFGTDTRTQITQTTSDYPYLVIGQLDIPIGPYIYGCSASLVSSTSVLTAGHCVHSGSTTGSFYNSVNFTPASDGDYEPFGTWTFKYLTVFGGWKKKSSYNWDMGVVTYNPNDKGLPGDFLGWLPMAYPDPLGACKLPTQSVTGYPTDKDYGTMWSTQCSKIKLACDGYIGKTACDTYPGQSGSPVYDASVTTFSNGRFTVGVVYGVVSYHHGYDSVVYADSAYPTYYNGFNMLNSYKWPSIIKWVAKS